MRTSKSFLEFDLRAVGEGWLVASPFQPTCKGSETMDANINIKHNAGVCIMNNFATLW
jgi:hypothetical protein